MTNVQIAEQIIRGKRKSILVGDLKRATAIRVAGHRLGSVLTAKRDKNGWRLTQSSAQVSHRRKTAKRSSPRRTA